MRQDGKIAFWLSVAISITACLVLLVEYSGAACVQKTGYVWTCLSTDGHPTIPAVEGARNGGVEYRLNIASGNIDLYAAANNAWYGPLGDGAASNTAPTHGNERHSFEAASNDYASNSAANAGAAANSYTAAATNFLQYERFSMVDSITVTNTTNEVLIAAVNVPANTLQAGTTLQCQIYGATNAQGVGATNITSFVKVGAYNSGTLINSSNWTPNVGTNKSLSAYSFLCTLRNSGSAGNMSCASAPFNTPYVMTYNPSQYVGIDTTVDNVMNFSVKWGTANAQNKATYFPGFCEWKKI